MASKNESPRSFANSAALSRFRRVTLSSGVLAYADADTFELGTLTRATQTTDGYAAVDLHNDDATCIMVASGAITQYAGVYADASGKVASSGRIYLGIALDAATADGDEIEVLRSGRSNGKLYTAVAASAAVTNTTTQTAFDASYTIPANALKAGDRLRIFAQGIATATNSTDTLTVTLRIGTVDVLVSAAVDVANNDIFVISGEIVIRTAGASGTFVAAGSTNVGTPATATTRAASKPSTAIDTTATQNVNGTATWSVANSGNSVRLDILDIDRIAA